MMKCRVRCGAVKKGGCQWVRTIFRGRTGWAAEPVQPWEALNSQFREPSTHAASGQRSEEHTSELQSRLHLVCRLLLEKKKHITHNNSALLLLHSLSHPLRVSLAPSALSV